MCFDDKQERKSTRLSKYLVLLANMHDVDTTESSTLIESEREHTRLYESSQINNCLFIVTSRNDGLCFNSFSWVISEEEA